MAKTTLLRAVIASSIAVCLLCAIVLMTYSLHAVNFGHLYDSDKHVSAQHDSVMHVYADHDSDKHVCELDNSSYETLL